MEGAFANPIPLDLYKMVGRRTSGLGTEGAVRALRLGQIPPSPSGFFVVPRHDWQWIANLPHILVYWLTSTSEGLISLREPMEAHFSQPIRSASSFEV